MSAIHKLLGNDNIHLKILANYIVLFICVAGFACGGVLAFILPILQIGLSWFHYHNNKKWQTVLLLELHLWIATVLGLYFLGYLYLRYISDDAESVLVFSEIWKIGAALVLGIGILTTLLKLIRSRRSAGA